MSTIPILQREPQVIASGDNVSWRRQIDAYNAVDWTLHYVIRSGTNVYKFDATNDAGQFLVTLTSAITAGWKPGVYVVGAYVTSGVQQVQVNTFFPKVTITPNLASNPNGDNPLSFAVRALATIEETILALTSRKIQTASVNGQAYTLSNINDLFTLRERFKSEVAREEEQARLNAGLGARNKIAVRFKSINNLSWPPSVRPPWL